MNSKQIDICFSEAQANFAVALHEQTQHLNIKKERVSEIVITEANPRDKAPCEFDPKHFENAPDLWVVTAEIP